MGSLISIDRLPCCVDEKDFRLLASLHENARQSYRQLGKHVSLSAPAVRDRLKRLESRHILQGYWVYVDPAALGREDLLVFFEGDFDRQDLLRVLATPDVAFAAWKVDGGITAQLWPMDHTRPFKELTSTLGSSPTWQAYSQPTKLQPLSLADWRIIDALLDDASMSSSKIVELTGLSPKTVRAHLTKIVQDEAIYIMPLLGSLADSGELVYHVGVFGHVGMPELRRVLGDDARMIGRADEPEMRYVLCRAKDLTDVTYRTKKAERLPGVQSVRVTLNRELLPGNRFARSLVREKIRQSSFS